MEAKARDYFTAWNTHSGAAIAAFFASGATLRDWEVEAHGADKIGEANAKIFAAVPAIKIEVLSVAVAEAARRATCEILVHINDEAKTVLKVADVIDFEAAPSLLFSGLRAYKG